MRIGRVRCLLVTWPAALSDAAVRATRSAAGRRALHLTLLVAAVFALGLLFAERAQAAEGAPTDVPVTGLADGPADARTDVPALPEVRSELPSVHQPVGRQISSLPSLHPSLREVTKPVPFPELPELPGLPDTPGSTLTVSSAQEPEPEPTRTPAPTPKPDRGQPSAPEAASGPGGRPEGPASQSADDSPTTGRPAGNAAAAMHGPKTPGVSSGTGTPAPSLAARTSNPAGNESAAMPDTGPGGPVPVPRVPGGQPDGTVSCRSIADHCTPRFGDAYAVMPNHRSPLRLVPGATARAEAPATRDRHQDVPVSPA